MFASVFFFAKKNSIWIWIWTCFWFTVWAEHKSEDRFKVQLYWPEYLFIWIHQKFNSIIFNYIRCYLMNCSIFLLIFCFVSLIWPTIQTRICLVCFTFSFPVTFDTSWRFAWPALFTRTYQDQHFSLKPSLYFVNHLLSPCHAFLDKNQILYIVCFVLFERFCFTRYVLAFESFFFLAFAVHDK